MNIIFRLIKKLLPRRIFSLIQPTYHYLLSLLGAIIYRWPGKKLIVIAVTGTKGKTSTTEILAQLLHFSGKKVASTSTIQFRLGEKTERNLFKMSMPGRFFLQKFLYRAVKNNCQYAILEVTSEGARLYRHKFIPFDGLIFTNISPEHIESHGSYEKYLEAKLEYAKALKASSKKKKILVINDEDVESPKFVEQAGAEVKIIKFSLAQAEPYTLHEDNIDFTFAEEKMSVNLSGKFNLANVLAASQMALALGLTPQEIKLALTKLIAIAGRMERVQSGHPKQDFEVIVDYAHTADSLTKAYEALENKRKICVLGATGGGRDKWKRPQMGKVANDNCEEIILTNDDPYDEDPLQIIKEVGAGITKNYQSIVDRREAINTAIRLAQKLSQDGNQNKVAVLITGKGTDPYLMEAGGKKTPWSDYEVSREEILRVLN